MTAFKNILVGTDFGEASNRAVDLAIDLAKTFDAKLAVVHAWELPSWAYTGMEFSTVDFFGPIEAAAQRDLNEKIASVRDKVPGAVAILRSGVPWKEILATAEHTHADLIVLGTHGRRGLTHALLGSVAERVVRLSPQPVLTVRGR